MEQPQIVIPGYPIHEYRLVLRPPQAVRDRLDHLRGALKKDHQLAGAQSGFNHVLIASFRQFAATEEKLTNRLRHVFSALAPFKIQMQSFRSLPAHTIYLEVPYTVAFQNMVKELRQHQSLLRVPQHDPFIVSLPKIVLAQKLNPRQYETMWPILERRHFKAAFIAEDLLFLRRRSGEANWQILERFPFLNMPVLASQGVLF
jgi:2'-5' RNA ligase